MASTTTTVDTTSNGNIEDFKIGGTAITSYTYNQANQMASVTGGLGASATYEYGLDGQRLLKTPSNGYAITYQYGQAAKENLSKKVQTRRAARAAAAAFQAVPVSVFLGVI